MSQLDEVSLRILAELEEAGEENIFSMLNTIIEPKGVDTEVVAFKQALGILLTEGLVTLGLGTSGSRTIEPKSLQESQSLIADLNSWFRFDMSRRLWTLGQGDLREATIPEIRLTKAGRARSEKVLGERGYQWWRQGRE